MQWSLICTLSNLLLTKDTTEWKSSSFASKKFLIQPLNGCISMAVTSSKFADTPVRENKL